MEENRIKQRIKEVQEIYVDKYPKGFGVYKVDDDSISVGYLYESNNDRWHTSTSDAWYPVFDPVEHVYNVLTLGYKPFYISDYVHAECWKETYETFEDLDNIYFENYHHGRRAYFEYCQEQGIDSQYIQQLADDADICTANTCFDNFEKILSEQINEKLKECENIEPVTLKHYTYLLNEPFYSEIQLGYTLEDINHECVSYFPFDYSCYVMIKGKENLDVFNLEDWGFDFQSDLFDKLKDGGQIRFMSVDMHMNVMFELLGLDRTEYPPDVQVGIKKYLKYSKRIHVDQLVPAEYQKMLQEVYKKYDVPMKEKKMGNQKER